MSSVDMSVEPSMAEALSSVNEISEMSDSPQYHETFTAESSRCSSPVSENLMNNDSDDEPTGAWKDFDDNDDDIVEPKVEQVLTFPKNSHNSSNNSTPNGHQSMNNSSSNTDSASLLNLQKQMLLEEMAKFQAKQKELKEKNRKAKMAAAVASMMTSTGSVQSMASISSKRPSAMSILNNSVPNVPDAQQPEFQQLLLEYRQVLLDVLAKSFKAVDAEVDPHTGMRMPLKCQCGFNSKISNQVTRTANYVHQLELKFRSLVEPNRENEIKYTPKRPPFISGDSYPPFGKQQQQQQQQQQVSTVAPTAVAPKSQQMPKLKTPQMMMAASLFGQSGASSITSSVNGEDDDDNDSVGDGEHSDVNDQCSEMLDEMNNVIPSGGKGKTILEGYLESMKNGNAKNSSIPDDDDDEMPHQNFMQPETNVPSLPKIDPKMKKVIVDMYKQGIPVNTIAKVLKTSKQMIRKIVMQDARPEKHQSASLLASIFNGNGLMSNKRKMNSVDDDEMLEESMHLDKSDDEDDDGSHDEAEMLHKMASNKYPMLFNQQQQQQPKSNNNTLSNLMQSAAMLNGGSLDKSLLAATMNRSLLNNPAMMQQMKQSIKKLEQQQQQSNGNVSSKVNFELLNQRLSKSKSIVPGLSRSSLDWNQYSPQQKGMAAHNNSALGIAHSPQLMKQKSEKKMRLSEPNPTKSMKMEYMEQADKNNNTTINNCSNSDSGSVNGSPPKEGAQLPPIPPGLVEDDQESMLVPREFHDGVLPAQMMNSLNPNRATKLTLEDFNVVWQLRSQHWTHNQIRKYFEQRGKSISKSSISRIMNGKQRNFQAYFAVVPTKN